MPSVTITLTDTPMGGIAIRTDFTPAVGKPCSLAQAAALDILNRSHKDFGLTAAAMAPEAPPARKIVKISRRPAADGVMHVPV